MENATDDIISAIQRDEFPRNAMDGSDAASSWPFRQFVDDLNPEFCVLRAGHGVLAGHNEKRHALNTAGAGRAVGVYDGVAIRPRIQQPRGQGGVHAYARRDVQQHVTGANILPSLEIGAEQVADGGVLLALQPGPMNKRMGGQRVGLAR